MSAVLASMNPEIAVSDALCAYWLAQVTLRLRRETAWCWRQRGVGAPPKGALPPPGDPVQDSLDLARFRADKRAFFASDPTACYLSDRIDAPPPPRGTGVCHGEWAWVAREAALAPAAQFVLACALAGRADASIGAVCASCQNDLSRPWPTLALAQRLWDDPLEIVACADAGHVLFRYGLLSLPAGRDALDWHSPLEMSAQLAQALLNPQNRPPGIVAAEDVTPRELPPAMRPLLARMQSDPPTAMQVLPLQGTHGADFAGWACALAQATGRGLRVLDDTIVPNYSLGAIAAASWLHGADLLLPEHWYEHCCTGASDHWFAPVATLPLRWYLPVDRASAVRGVPAQLLLPACSIPVPDVAERSARLASVLDGCASAMCDAIPEAARRFRLAEHTLERAAAAARALGRGAGAHELFAVCRAEARLELDGLATAVAPRFTLDELVLPAAQSQQLREIVAAMRVLGIVHYEWGTARTWSEAGLSALFCGPSGTGKTMAAEAIANALELPMYRIDLSQVVNKYIGETEKNLKRIFDAAEASDCLMFFDEADALFGKRTEVRDAHDRFANIEIGYLLERMERFKGIAVLASNRRKDFDEAFTRRLRFIVEFPVPGVSERERLWRQAFPACVDIDEIECRWLAQQFELPGGHIRSAAFNACLLAAAKRPDAPARVGMSHVLVAVQRELEKLNRVSGREQFGRYADLVGSVA